MVKKKFFRRKDKEYKKIKRPKKTPKKEITPEEVKARKKAQRTLMFKKKESNDHKI